MINRRNKRLCRQKERETGEEGRGEVEKAGGGRRGKRGREGRKREKRGRRGREKKEKEGQARGRADLNLSFT